MCKWCFGLLLGLAVGCGGQQAGTIADHDALEQYAAENPDSVPREPGTEGR